MIKLENSEVVGWEHAIRGMRNPKNSWTRSDSVMRNTVLVDAEVCPGVTATIHKPCTPYISIGGNDHELMMKLAKAGPVHGKFRRMIIVYVDITAPLYWWKEFDTYKVGTVANSCSTMHKIHAKKFEMSDFSTEHLMPSSFKCLGFTVKTLNQYRDWYLVYDKLKNEEIPVSDEVRRLIEKYSKKEIWYQMIQLLPSSYNQKRTIMFSYEVLANMYEYRKTHKLDEWREFCKWIETLPYSELITGGNDESNK